MADDALLTPAQVARRLQVTERTVTDWLRTGRLPGVKLGRLWRVHSEALETALRVKRPDDFDEPLSAAEAAASDAAWQAYVSGEDPGESLAEVRRQLLVERRD